MAAKNARPPPPPQRPAPQLEGLHQVRVALVSLAHQSYKICDSSSTLLRVSHVMALAPVFSLCCRAHVTIGGIKIWDPNDTLYSVYQPI